MFVWSRARNRPVHLGPYPLETLPRDSAVISREAELASSPGATNPDASGPLAASVHTYLHLLAGQVDGEVAACVAPMPDALEPRSHDLKAAAYFLDVSQAGIARIPESAWTGPARPDGRAYALVLVCEHPRDPEKDNIAYGWTLGGNHLASVLRAAEVAVVLAGYIRQMGFAARAHFPGASLLDLGRMAVLAGLATRHGDGLSNPYLGDAFSISAVSTCYELARDLPLADTVRDARGLRWWWGLNGARSGREVRRRKRRPTHASRYPMEQVRRVDRPTTLILDDEVPRVPKRAAFFQRALHGDLGQKAKAERGRFAFKTPLSMALLRVIRTMVPYQDGEVAGSTGRPALQDPVANARAIKSLSYLLGADLTGICGVPQYAWFSHRENGEEIDTYHENAIVMLIDQGFDTMEGSSGDDWISGVQSMRAYLRGAVIAGVMADLLRRLGFPSRAQTNADSDVLHIPLILWAGLGEMSRIGELVLNPFVGPRFKSVVLTTNLPLEADKPVDFGLQDFCSNCLKCARECPCSAIPFGSKVMFNGYETWKPDVERCTRYRLTNVRGSACGRCMKTCPINKVVDADGAVLTRIASWLGINALWLKPLMVPIATWFDDWIGNGRINPVKKWWFDHELIDGVAVVPPHGTNRRELDVTRMVDPETQRIAHFHASMMPPPDEGAAVPLDRKAGLGAASAMESPQDAEARKAAGGRRPDHYVPTPPSGKGRGLLHDTGNPYRKS